MLPACVVRSSNIADEDAAEMVGVGVSTVYRTKRRFVGANLEGALCEETRLGAERKPRPRKKPCCWRSESLSRKTARRRLAEKELKPWRKDTWCIFFKCLSGLPGIQAVNSIGALSEIKSTTTWPLTCFPNLGPLEAGKF